VECGCALLLRPRGSGAECGGHLALVAGAPADRVALPPEVIGELFAVRGIVLDPGGAVFGAAAETSGMEFVIGR
jgi:hypothetical protein